MYKKQPSLRNVSLADVQGHVGSRAYSLGAQYVRENRVELARVQRIEPREGLSRIQIVAKTQGSESYRYTQNILFSLYANKPMTFDGSCSCPVGYRCKHIAAAAISYVQGNTDLPDSALMDVVASTQDTQRDTHRGGDGASTAEVVSTPPENEALQWLDKLMETDANSGSSGEGFLVYILSESLRGGRKQTTHGIQLEVRATRMKADGSGLMRGSEVGSTAISQCYQYENGDYKVAPVDRDIAQLIKAQDSEGFYYSEVRPSGASGAILIKMIIDTGRCFWQSAANRKIEWGDVATLKPVWRQLESDELHLDLQLAQNLTLLPTNPVLALDTEQCRVRPLSDTRWSFSQLHMLAATPKLSRQQAVELSHAVMGKYPDLPLPLPHALEIQEISDVAPLPKLRLLQQQEGLRPTRTAELRFEYEGYPVSMDGRSVQTQRRGDGWVKIKRDLAYEQLCANRLESLGLEQQKGSESAHALTFTTPSANPEITSLQWATFVDQGMPELEADAWVMELDEDFTLRVRDGEWSAEIEDFEDIANNQWFNLRFDLTVGDKKIPMAPVLAPILGMDVHRLPETLLLPLPNGEYVRLPSQRIKPFIKTLHELFDRAGLPEDGTVKLSRFDAATLYNLQRDGVAVEGGKQLQEMAAKLAEFDGIKTVDIPADVNATLRPYQCAGVSWLQFLTEYQFSGILADDMGLGKTIQTLVHLQIEKNQGRLNAPALIVAPTSLMSNWRREAEQFTPKLSVLVLQGVDRANHFEEMCDYDLVLTTYPLLSRDSDVLLQHNYHSLILDEAQAVKNPRTKTARTIRQIKTNHRLCLTGTPLENHLGELWSLFDFLMPGFLGTSAVFKRVYRSPIEKYGDLDRRDSLAQRVRPFMLRRLKDQVAADLPSKTEIEKTVVLEGEQADLYETIRISMDKRVRDVIASQGLARSHITVLDALLKLRQVCCDPRLLKLETQTRTAGSAKLELLMEMLPELLEEGRKILLFSQFTSMLSLIEKSLKAADIEYSKLTGQTRDRDAAIQRFRDGEVDLFLVSLKAGGVGLNLTEADTVILYDPWWNPAVENQAIDRAHRIGQDKPVFVYKLVAENSIEQKMLEMQARKRALAGGIYDPQAQQDVPLLDAENLESLFAPLDAD